jgi:hypothetical protein
MTFLLPEQTMQALQLLGCGQMTDPHEAGIVRWSTNGTHLVSIVAPDDDPQTAAKVLAIYKPQRGERRLWDFPDGTLCYRETAAFLISDALAWHIVPPTVLRDGLRGLGSVQYYIQHNPSFTYFKLDDGYSEPLKRMCAFDYLINNTDRKGGHCIVDGRGRLWGIDHGLGFHPSPKLRTVIWDFAGQPITKMLLADIDRVYCLLEDENSPLRLRLDELLDNAEVMSLLARMRKLLQRGEYPRPGVGANMPWPPE